MKEMIIMMGGSGMGKSFLVEAIVAKYLSLGAECAVCSTDNYWYTQCGDDVNEYSFDYKLLHAAHKWNQDQARQHVEGGTEVVIIDNTNLNKRDMKYYKDVAIENGYTIRIIGVGGSLDTALESQRQRPNDRSVPADVVENMFNKLPDILKV